MVFGFALGTALAILIVALVIIGLAIVVFRGLAMRFSARR
jgi:hypothetical protein